jgi:hypothetical protein
MEAKGDGPEEAPMAEQKPQESLAMRERRGWNDSGTPALEGDHAAHQMTRKNRRVVLRQGVAAGAQHGDVVLDNTVRPNPAVALEDRDLAGEQFGERDGLNIDDIAGPDSRQHAAAEDAQPQPPGGADDLRCQAAPRRVPRASEDRVFRHRELHAGLMSL